MALLKTVTVGDRIIDLFTFHGEVLEEKKWATTQVSGQRWRHQCRVGPAQSGHDYFNPARLMTSSFFAVTMAMNRRLNLPMPGSPCEKVTA